MLENVNATTLVLLSLLMVAGAWWFISWTMKPVVRLDITAYDRVTQYGDQRITERVNLIQNTPIDLRSGGNEFYLVVQKGVLLQYPISSANLLNPILRGNEDTLFFKVHVRVIGTRVVKFDATNLSKSNARLVWSKV